MSDKREHVRLVPKQPDEFRVFVSAEGEVFEARLVDYSAFGMGALLPWSERAAAVLEPGRAFSFQCMFGASRFPSKGRVANAVSFEDADGRWLRLGISLLCEATPTRERLTQRRSELRLEVDAHLSPLCVCEDDLWFGERLFLRARDVSATGMALELPSERVPFLPKQRIWLRVLLPFFGEFKSYVRIAYVKKMETPEGGTPSHLVGVTMLRSVVDLSAVLCDYLFYTHGEFDIADLRQAGFDVGHLGTTDAAHRPRIVRSQGGDAWNADELEFQVETAQGDITARGLLALEGGGGKLQLKVFKGEGLPVLAPFLKFLFLYAHAHACETFSIAPDARDALRVLWPLVPEALRIPGDLAARIPVKTLVALAPLFHKRLQAPRGPRGSLLKALGAASGFLSF